MRKTVLITGGTGGIAKAIAKLLNKNRYIVYAPSHKELDVTKEKEVKKYFKKYRPYILINSVGYITPSSIKEMSLTNWNKHIEINLTGSFLCGKYAIREGCATIINIGSTSGFESRENWGAYCISKAGVMALTEVLVKEGINAYSLNPARTKTEMRKKLFPNEDKTTLMKPSRIAKFALKILKGEFIKGSHIIVKKNGYYVLPMRKGV